MKKVFLILLSIITIGSFAQEKSKDVKTLTLKVAGNCEQCKNRIENASDIKGVKVAEWDSKTQMLKVTYRPDKVTEEQIKQAVLSSGHDVEGAKAPDAAYDKLPDCCKFRDKKCTK
ncbi:MAG: heavy-metal-associated domain-containing protein [Bacteroidia bacterium]